MALLIINKSFTAITSDEKKDFYSNKNGNQDN